jgi:hypothetical protein
MPGGPTLIRRAGPTIERVKVPGDVADLIRSRCDGLLRASALDENPTRFLMLSCYLQGASDVLDAVERRDA